MPAIHYNDRVVLKRHRPRSSISDGHVVFDSSTTRTISIAPKTRRATLIGIPPTLIGTSNQDLQKNLCVQPTVFFYSQQTFQEACYRSIEDIRAIDENECLWIDVTGVSCEESCGINFLMDEILGS